MTPDNLRHPDPHLQELLEWRRDIPEQVPSGATLEDIEALRQEAEAGISEYTRREVAKQVDGIAGLILQGRDQLDVILGPKDRNGTRRGGEIDRLKARAEQIQADEELVRGLCKEALETLPEPAKGSRQYRGTLHTIKLQANGGIEPLAISEPGMVPREFCRMHGWITASAWQVVCDTLELIDEIVEGRDYQFTREPWPQAIREELEKPCEACKGTGNFFLPPVMAGEQELIASSRIDCTACGGTGRRGVPGASIQPRGFHVRVK